MACFNQESPPGTNMTTTKVELNANKIARISDASDLAELLFPSNRNQQHAFLVIWFTLNWAGPDLVPNLNEFADRQDVSPRTLARVRAKLRRLGLLDHVSRFNARHGYREGWVRSTRFEHSLAQLAEKVAALADLACTARDKDELLLALARARRDVARQQPGPKTAAVEAFHPRGEQP